MIASKKPRLLARGLTLAHDGVALLRGVDLAVTPGAFHVFAGAGGAALVRVLGLLERPAAGKVMLEGVATNQLDDEARAELRAMRFGYLFDAPYLLPTLSLIENIAMPIFKIAQLDPPAARARTEALLGLVGIDPLRASISPEQLPPAVQHRVALARALAHLPEFLVIENASALPGAETLLPLVRHAAREFGITVLAAADADFPCAPEDRVIELADGAARVRAHAAQA